MLLCERRSDLEVVADILRINGAKTAIMYGANLSHAQTQKYLGRLIELSLLEPVDGGSRRRQYRPTPKGRKFLELLDAMEDLVSEPQPAPHPVGLRAVPQAVGAR